MATFLSSDFCPYKGLQPYTEEDQPYFFGRERDQEIIASNLFAASLTILYGSSGVGKSSVLMAGVVPQLRALSRVVVVMFRAWQNANFLTALKQQTLQTVSQVAGKPIQVDAALAFDDFVGECAAALRGTQNVFFIFDQFEEYFLYHPASADENSFDAEFARAVNRREISANFVISLREDSLSRLDRFKGRIPNLLGNMLRLEHLDHESAVNAMRNPLEEYNRHIDPSHMPLKIEDGLVDAVIDQVRTGGVVIGTGDGIGALRQAAGDVRIETPYLQLVMTRLWDEETRAGSKTLRLATLKKLGGAQQIVHTHLDKTMNRLAGGERQIASRAFRFLVTPSRTKIAYTAEDLASYAQVPLNKLAPVLQKLAAPDVRVLRSVVAVGENQPPMYEIFHDVLTPAILDWRDRYLEQKRTRTLQIVGAVVAAAFLFVILSSFVLQLTTTAAVSQQVKATAAQVAQATVTQQAQVAQTQVRAEQQQAQVAQTSVADLQQNVQQQSATQTAVARATANAVATQDLSVQLAAQTSQAQVANAQTVVAVSQLALQTAPPPIAPGVTSTPEPTVVSARKTVAVAATSAAQAVKFAIEEIRVNVSPDSSVTCPTIFTATVSIRVNQPGTVTYRGELDDKTTLPQNSITFDAAGIKTVAYTWSRNYPDAGSFRVQILTPSTATSNWVSWQLKPSYLPDWMEAKLSKSTQIQTLGCPQGASLAISSGRQPFQNGLMYWRGDNKQIYVLLSTTPLFRQTPLNTWKTYADTWDETQPVSGSNTPPRGLFEPVRGFGKVWRDQLGEPKSQVIGWATAPEEGGYMQLQNFDNGFVMQDGKGDFRILFVDGKWTLP